MNKNKKYRTKIPDDANIKRREVIVERWVQRLKRFLERGKTEIL